MKKKELVAIACLLCFCCCNGTEKEVPNPRPTRGIITHTVYDRFTKGSITLPRNQEYSRAEYP